jgi:hypothetical protein
MFSHEEFAADIQLLEEIYTRRASEEQYYLEVIDTPEIIALKEKSFDDFLWQIILCYRGLMFSNDAEPKTKFKRLLKTDKPLIWFTPLLIISEGITNFSKSLNGQVLHGLLLIQIINYLEIKIAHEILSWGGKDVEHNGKPETPILFKDLDNIYRRKKYSGGNSLDSLNEYDKRMIDLTNDFERIAEDSELAKNLFLKYAQGNIEKVYATAILKTLAPPSIEIMPKTEFYTLLFDLFFLIFKDIGWLTFEAFESKCLEKDSHYLSYSPNDFKKGYRKYKARQVKSLLKPSRTIPS